MGTYTIFDKERSILIIPAFEGASNKGVQSRLIGLRGSDDAGNPLEVNANPSLVDFSIELASKRPVVNVKGDLWVYRISAGPIAGQETLLEARTAVALPGKPKGTLCATLQVKITPQEVTSSKLPSWDGGSEIETQNAIIDECFRRNGDGDTPAFRLLDLDTQIAYILATVEHESKFQPLREAQRPGSDPESSERTRRTNPKISGYYPYYGRGYVQLTLKGNYAFYSTVLLSDLENDPDLALQPNVALFTLVDGMIRGKFTSKPLEKWVNGKITHFRFARQVVNGLDRAEDIQFLARKWLKTLRFRRIGRRGPDDADPPH